MKDDRAVPAPQLAEAAVGVPRLESIPAMQQPLPRCLSVAAPNAPVLIRGHQ